MNSKLLIKLSELWFCMTRDANGDPIQKSSRKLFLWLADWLWASRLKDGAPITFVHRNCIEQNAGREKILPQRIQHLHRIGIMVTVITAQAIAPISAAATPASPPRNSLFSGRRSVSATAICLIARIFEH